MDAKEQAAGENRVQEILIAPLEALGLARPSTSTLAKFEVMKKELRQKLAYMSEDGLTELREWIEAHPEGKNKDRFPIALKILAKARKLEAPDTGPSPLMLNVFRDELGLRAIRQGWAPELLAFIKGARDFPGPWSQTKIREQADDPVRRLEDIEMRLARGDAISAEEDRFRLQRRAALQTCQDIADQARRKGAA
ncbi:hypothetical protein PXK30_05240 [Phaeobacter gallaeciensis]|uniref:hypothetical protein n=1 Tax=Phaeobacter gallaeciensis TaxID=60890 RepID=UPI00237F603D|nr:hypothetical protein [Phaeobacter gallaeciensis]MDE4302864.1 hypothetical protein [Phaeobacter gallaeciensis]MDE4307043.1 hypothetical protein [Phaeobacter gallaeciensis]MDE4311508.1 hypothetical protein [Phaeobacter gallaeciensis]MDE4316185.1 hypothetical protein [Phaeobacter gallaeciensis]MDE4320435.1 hypothetical protein [Phaeobacter gallaeciensis]